MGAFAGMVGTIQQQAGTLMHEFGHNLTWVTGAVTVVILSRTTQHHELQVPILRYPADGRTITPVRPALLDEN